MINSAVNIPQLTEILRGPAHTGFIFLTCMIGALLTIFWKGLRSRDSYWTLPFIFFTAPVFWLIFALIASLAGIKTINTIQEFSLHSILGSRVSAAVIYALLIQLFIAWVVAVEQWLRIRNDRFMIRRAATDREEQENLFEIKDRHDPEDDLSFYKFQVLLGRGLCLVGDLKRKQLGFIQAFRIEDDIFLYNLVADVKTEGFVLERRLIQAMLGRYELDGANRLIVLLRHEDTPAAQAFRAEGFVPLSSRLSTEKGSGDTEPEVIREMRVYMERHLKDKVGDWSPFSGHHVYLSYGGALPIQIPAPTL